MPYKDREIEKKYYSIGEVADMFGTTSDTLRSLRQSAAHTVSLDAPAYKTTDDSSRSTLADIIPSNDVSIEEQIDNKRLQTRINEVLETLTEREKTIIKMRFGLES